MYNTSNHPKPSPETSKVLADDSVTLQESTKAANCTTEGSETNHPQKTTCNSHEYLAHEGTTQRFAKTLDAVPNKKKKSHSSNDSESRTPRQQQNINLPTTLAPAPDHAVEKIIGTLIQVPDQDKSHDVKEGSATVSSIKYKVIVDNAMNNYNKHLRNERQYNTFYNQDNNDMPPRQADRRNSKTGSVNEPVRLSESQRIFDLASSNPRFSQEVQPYEHSPQQMIQQNLVQPYQGLNATQDHRYPYVQNQNLSHDQARSRELPQYGETSAKSHNAEGRLHEFHQQELYQHPSDKKRSSVQPYAQPLDADDSSSHDEEDNRLPSSSPGPIDTSNSASFRQNNPPWSEALHRQLVEAIYEIGISHASPAVILEHMTTLGSANGVAPKESSASINNSPSGGGHRDRSGGGSVDGRSASRRSSVESVESVENSNPVTSERVKSHLQKYRKNKDKSKDEYLCEYDAWLQKALTVGIASAASHRNSGSQVSASTVLELMGGSERKLLGGDLAAFLSYSVMLEEQQVHTDYEGGTMSTETGMQRTNQGTSSYPESAGSYENDVGGVSTAAFNSRKRYLPSEQANENDSKLIRLTGARIPFPVLTEDERKSSLGESISHVIGLFHSMTHHLMKEREKERKNLVATKDDEEQHASTNLLPASANSYPETQNQRDAAGPLMNDQRWQPPPSNKRSRHDHGMPANHDINFLQRNHAMNQADSSLVPESDQPGREQPQSYQQIPLIAGNGSYQDQPDRGTNQPRRGNQGYQPIGYPLVNQEPQHQGSPFSHANDPRSNLSYTGYRTPTESGSGEQYEDRKKHGQGARGRSQHDRIENRPRHRDDDGKV